MTEAAIISGSLVDVRNVGTHKSVKLTIHVPEELAMKVMEAFGWPTGVSPVAVAVARLEPVSQRVQPPCSHAGNKPGRSAQPTVPAEQVVRADKERRKWADLSYTQQAGIRCSDPVFWAFLRETDHSHCNDEADAKDFVLHYCGITSRKELEVNNTAAVAWASLDAMYDDWQALDRVSA